MRCTENLKRKLFSNGFCQPWLLGFARVSTLPMSRIVMTNDKVVLYGDPCMILWFMLFYVHAIDLIIITLDRTLHLVQVRQLIIGYPSDVAILNRTVAVAAKLPRNDKLYDLVSS